MPIETRRGVKSLGTGVICSCNAVGSGTQLRSSARAAGVFTIEPFLQPVPQLVMWQEQSQGHLHIKGHFDSQETDPTRSSYSLLDDFVSNSFEIAQHPC